MGLFHWFAGGDDEPWRRLIKDRPVEAINEDDGELVEIKPEQDDPNDVEGLLIGFYYVDAVENPSKRDLLCWRCWTTHNDLYVRGYCTLREALRTFRVDRMIDAVEVRTKKPIDDPVAYFEHYADHEGDVGYINERTGFRGTRNQRAEFAERFSHARSVCIDGLRVIAYIAVLRGPVTDREQILKSTYIAARLDGCGFGKDNDLNVAVLKFALALVVPTRAFRELLKIVAREKDNFALVVAVINEITGGETAASNQPQIDAMNEILVAGQNSGLKVTFE